MATSGGDRVGTNGGDRLVTSGKDTVCIIYETATFTVLHTLAGHTAPVAYVTWSPDDTKLVTCSNDSKARVWDAMVSVSVFSVR